MGYLVLAFLAGLGLGASIACHLMGWLRLEPSWGKSLFMLHYGAFALWLPLMICANRAMPRRRRGKKFGHLLAQLPTYVRKTIGFLFAYALLNFGFLLYSTRRYPRLEVPFSVELRGFSGHWMLFYGVAAAGFVALARLARTRNDDAVAA